jgi:hypothetical protein
MVHINKAFEYTDQIHIFLTWQIKPIIKIIIFLFTVNVPLILRYNLIE